MPSVFWRCWLGGRKGIRSVKNWVVRCWHGYLSGARFRLAYAQLMPLPLTVSCFSKIQIAFTFLVPAHPGSPGKRAVKRVCVYVWVCNVFLMFLKIFLSNVFLHLWLRQQQADVVFSDISVKTGLRVTRVTFTITLRILEVLWDQARDRRTTDDGSNALRCTVTEQQWLVDRGTGHSGGVVSTCCTLALTETQPATTTPASANATGDAGNLVSRRPTILYPGQNLSSFCCRMLNVMAVNLLGAVRTRCGASINSNKDMKAYPLIKIITIFA